MGRATLGAADDEGPGAADDEEEETAAARRPPPEGAPKPETRGSLRRVVLGRGALSTMCVEDPLEDLTQHINKPVQIIGLAKDNDHNNRVGKLFERRKDGAWTVLILSLIHI